MWVNARGIGAYGHTGNRLWPGDPAVNGKLDDWRVIQRHCSVLGVPIAQRGERGFVFRAGVEQLCRAAKLDVSEAGPVLVVAVDEELDVGVGEQVANPTQLGDGDAFGFRVEDGVCDAVNVSEANGHNVRALPGVDRGEAGDAGFIVPRIRREGEAMARG